MKRIINLQVESCFECPLLRTICGYASHEFWCMGIGKISKDYDVSGQGDEELKVWFNEYCKFEKVSD